MQLGEGCGVAAQGHPGTQEEGLEAVGCRSLPCQALGLEGGGGAGLGDRLSLGWEVSMCVCVCVCVCVGGGGGVRLVAWLNAWGGRGVVGRILGKWADFLHFVHVVLGQVLAICCHDRCLPSRVG